MSRRRELIFSVLFGMTVAIVIYGASQTVLYWPFLNIQNKIDDANFLLRYKHRAHTVSSTDSIIIVDVDDRTLKALGRIKSKRWPRRHMAKAIGNLYRDGARLIFLDIIFEGLTRDNRELADSVRSAENVIAGYYFNLDYQSRRRRPLDSVYNELFSGNPLDVTNNTRAQFIHANDVVFPFTDLVRSVRALGFTNYIPDPDGVLRHIPLYISHGPGSGRASASASLQMWFFLNDIHYSQAKISHRGIRFGDFFVPTDKHCFMRLNYKSLGPFYPRVSFLDVLRGDFQPGIFRDRIVMIGSGSERVGDVKRIPGYGSLPGVEVHATALSTLLNGSFLTVLPANIVFIVTLALGIVSSVIFTFLSPWKAGLPFAILIPLSFYAAGIYSFIWHGVLINISVPSFTLLFLFTVIMIHRFFDHYEGRHLKNNENVKGTVSD